MSSSKTPPKFNEFVRDFAQGHLDDEMSKQLTELVGVLKSEAMAQGNNSTVKGELTLKIKMTAECNAGGRDVVIDTGYEVTRREPKPARARELFYADKGGALVRDQPRQQVLALTNKDLET